jgi:hypothetical protein
MNTIDQRKMDLVPLFEQGIEQLSHGKNYKIRPDPDGWRWNLVDAKTSAVLGSFTLGAVQARQLEGVAR